MKNKMYEVIIGSLTKVEVPPTSAQAQPTVKEEYNPDVKHIMVVAKDVNEAVSKVTLEEGQHIESVVRHNFIDIV